MFSGRISCFREEFNVFGKNSMFSGRIQCFREEFNVFGKNFMLLYVTYVFIYGKLAQTGK